MRAGDRAAALTFATRAFEAQPRSAWVAEQLFRVQTQQGAWDLAQKTIASQRRAGGLNREAAARREAVLLAAEALAADAAGEKEQALKLAEKAMAQAPGLVPMVVLVAQHKAEAGQSWASASMLEKAWRVHPHPDIAAAYAKLKPEETPEQRSRRLIGLAEFNADHVESRLLIAGEALKLGEVRRAKRTLAPALEMPGARVLMMMSEIALQGGNGAAEAQAFRARAVMAPRDGQWVCQECNRARPNWTPVCDGCGAFDTAVWGPTETLAAGELVPVPADVMADWAKDDGALVEVEAEVVALSTAPPPEKANPEVPPSPPASVPTETEAAAPFVPPRPPDDPGPDLGEERKSAF